MKSKVYTFTGDKGTTSLVGGTRVNKDDVRIESYGTIDELNSFIGLLASEATATDFTAPLQLLLSIQSKLFNLGAYLATENATEVWGLSDADVEKVEAAIDEMDAQVPPLNNFVLPGGNRFVSVCHVCRTVARRAERRIIALSHEAELQPLALRYINRLSDYFFVLARFNSFVTNSDEIFWQKDC